MPLQIWITSSLLLLLLYCTYVPPASKTAFWWLARTLRSYEFLDSLIIPSWVFLCVVHAAEGVYVATLVRKHHMPWHIGVCASSLSSTNLCYTTEPDADATGGLGQLGHDFWVSRAIEAAPSD
jgi:hypothetical protein